MVGTFYHCYIVEKNNLFGDPDANSMVIYSDISSMTLWLGRANYSYNLQRCNFLIPLRTQELVLGDVANLGELAKQLDKACNKTKHIIVDSCLF